MDGARALHEYAIAHGDEADAGKSRLAPALLLTSVDQVPEAERLLDELKRSPDAHLASMAFQLLAALRRGSVPPKPWDPED